MRNERYRKGFRAAGCRIGALFRANSGHARTRDHEHPPRPAGPSVAPRPPTVTTARITDATDDVHWTLRPPPGYTDITAAALSRTAEGFTLRVRFAAAPPPRQPDSDTTGDGEIDYEIWANLADNGWGPSYPARRHDVARFMADSGVDVRADVATLVFRFPLTLLDGATTFRWATATEWGSYQTLATPAADTDYAPDIGAAAFPG
ncbi:MAG: hypothetical protein GEV00_01185 [Actinophytocola sp.]|nr:hypothetical protein [Actinophytocola sp.]